MPVCFSVALCCERSADEDPRVVYPISREVFRRLWPDSWLSHGNSI